MLEANELWQEGLIACWYLRESQLDIYDHILKTKDPFIEAARRFGKTTSVLCYVLEQLIQNPGWHATWCEPDKNQARLIIQPEINKIQSYVNKENRFKWNVTDSFYKHPNGSKLFLRGLNHDKGDSARGSFAHIVILDELGSVKEARSVINDVLRPLLLTTQGKLITMSTPPSDLGHEYYEYKKTSIIENRFIQKTIFDNESLTNVQIQEAMLDAGGENSPSWQREYLCQPVADPERLVIPEFKESLHVKDDVPPANLYDRYVGIDLGFNDNTAFIFGYYDFHQKTLYIENEYVVKAKNSKSIMDDVKKIESDIWQEFKPYRRVCDNDLQQIYDMHTMYAYTVLPAKKDDKVAAVNLLRDRFEKNQIVIHSRCVNLIYQLKVGLWANQKQFQRGEKTGHLDCIDALIYLNRSINLNRNPIPKAIPTRDEVDIDAYYEMTNNKKQNFLKVKGLN